MNENMNFHVKNLGFSTLKPTAEEFGPKRLSEIIEALKDEEPVIIKYGAFSNRWEETKAFTQNTVGLNRYRKAK